MSGEREFGGDKGRRRAHRRSGGEEAFLQGDRARKIGHRGFRKEKETVATGSKWSAKWIAKRVHF